METLIIIFIIVFIAYEFMEHVAFPLFGSLGNRKKKSLHGPGRILGEVGNVKNWQGKEGYIFVDGELWRAVSEIPLKTGNKVEVQKIEGLTLTVDLLNPVDQSVQTPSGQPLAREK